jgi:thiamine biosynthesis lipoprotein
VEAWRFRAWETACVLAVTDARARDRARAIVERELAEIDKACSRFRSDSQLVRLNAFAGEPTRVSELLFAAVGVALHAAEKTGGLVDPTIGKTLRLAGYDETFTVIRGRDGRLFRARFVRGPDWRSVVLDVRARTVLLPRGVELDLGATAKALAADRCAQAVFEAVGGGVLVSLGGDIATAGTSPAGGWPVRIADDNAAPLDEPGPTVAISSGALATSGTTVRRWTTQTGEFHHIIDPRTARPARSPWRTVSVAASNCVEANTASTAAIVLADEAPAWLGNHELPARLVRYDGAPTFVAGWPEDQG